MFLGKIAELYPDPREDSNLVKLVSWANKFSRLEVWANADYPTDIRHAQEWGARGIGLCRTEHMFFSSERLATFQAAMLSELKNDREMLLAQMLPLLRSDFEEIFAAARGLPVVIRLIDSPLHEFLPDYESTLIRETSPTSGNADKSVEKQRLLGVIEGLRESNPIIGQPGFD